MQKLIDEKTELFSDLKKQLLEEITGLLEDPDSLLTADSRSAETCRLCCEAIDALDPSCKDSILLEIALKRLEPYKKNYAFVVSSTATDRRKADALASLDLTIQRRSHWIKTCLADTGNSVRKFLPEHWDPERLICHHFCLITRQHLVSTLEVCSDSLDSARLLKLMNEVAELENLLSTIVKEKSLPSQSAIPSNMSYRDLLPPEIDPDASVTGLHSHSLPSNRTDHQPFRGFQRSIGRVFDSFLGGWRQEQDRKIQSLLTSNTDEVADLSSQTDSAKRVRANALELFKAIRRSFDQVRSVNSAQMHRDMLALVRKTVMSYATPLGSTKRASKLESALGERDRQNVFLKVLRVNPAWLAPVEEAASQGSTFGNSSLTHDMTWMTSILGDRALKARAELTDFADLVLNLSTLQFIEDTLPNLEAMIMQSTDMTASLSDAKDFVWHCKGRMLLLLFTHFDIFVVEKEALGPIRTLQNINSVQAVSAWAHNTLSAWHDWLNCCRASLSDIFCDILIESVTR